MSFRCHRQTGEASHSESEVVFPASIQEVTVASFCRGVVARPTSAVIFRFLLSAWFTNTSQLLGHDLVSAQLRPKPSVFDDGAVPAQDGPAPARSNIPFGRRRSATSSASETAPLLPRTGGCSGVLRCAPCQVSRFQHHGPASATRHARRSPARGRCLFRRQHSTCASSSPPH